MVWKDLIAFFALLVLFAGMICVSAQTPDPGHPANEIGAGVFGEVGNYIFPSGSKVGIGDSSPDATLDVAGNLELLNGSERLRWGSKHYGSSDFRSYLAPRKADDSGWDWNQEFGYHWLNRAWYFDGDVGIGTVAPQEKLDVVGDIRLTGNINGGADDRLNIYSDTSATNSRSWIELWGNDASRAGELNLAGMYIAFRSGSTTTSSGSEKMRITSAGDVGIGTTNPDEDLEIAVSDTSDPAMIFDSDGNEFTVGIDSSDSDKFKISDSTALGLNDRVIIDSSGKVGIGDSAPSSRLDIGEGPVGDYNSEGHLRFDSSSSDASLRMGLNTNYAWIQSHNGKSLHINDANNLVLAEGSGKVGIGTANPSKKLHVDGDVIIDGDLTIAPGGSIILPGGEGTDNDNDGYVLLNEPVSATIIDSTGVSTTTVYGDDCYDENADARPGQTAWFNVDRGDGSFDYDCDGVIEYQASTSYGCVNSYNGGNYNYYRGALPSINPNIEYYCTSSTYPYLQIEVTSKRCYSWISCGVGSPYTNAHNRSAFRH